jgi:perosamine synthetase
MKFGYPLAIHGGPPVRNSLLHVMNPMIEDEEISAVVEVLKSNWISEGKNVVEFEDNYKKYLGMKYAIALSSGTAALHTACASCGIKKGDEVIVPSFTHISTANSVLYVGAKPIFAEINPKTYTIDPVDVENKLTKRTKALIVVHWAGHPADLNALSDIADRNNLHLIEDACQAHGSLYDNKKIGSFGEVACFSFYPSKIITTGEGGMVITNNIKIANKARSFKNYGQKEGQRFRHDILGYNYKITDIQAAIGNIQLKKIEIIINKKIDVATKLSERLKTIEGISPPLVRHNIRHGFMHYMAKINEKEFGHSRDFLLNALTAENIEARIYIPPVHLQPYYKKRFRYKEGDLPITENVFKEVITLPSSITMNDADINDIIDAINKIKDS